MAGEKDDIKQEEKDDIFTELNPEDLSDELQATYKSMQGDYTRKTQELADARKQIETDQATWNQQNAEKFETLGSVQKEVEQWRAWSASLQNQKKDDDQDDSSSESDDTFEGSEKMTKRLMELENSIAALKQTSDKSNVEVGRMLRYQDELNDLKATDPGVDKEKMIEFMLKEGISDPRRAYRELYQDEIIEREAQVKYDKMLAEFQEKQKADMITGPGTPNIESSFYQPPAKGKPDAWDKTLDEVLIDHRKSEAGLT